MYTVGRLARKFGLSRSTLLYYDRIGLLKPSGRSRSGYRQYTSKDAERLEQIHTYREAGLPLAAIRDALSGRPGRIATALERRLEELNDDIRRLRNQQRLILGLLRNRHLVARIGVMNVERWVSLLDAAGFSAEDRRRWHQDFERTAPAKHQEFLEFLCLPEEEIRGIRQWSRQQDNPADG